MYIYYMAFDPIQFYSIQLDAFLAGCEPSTLHLYLHQGTVNSRATEIQMLKYQMTEFHIFFI